jgi:hypothetical protein
MVMDLLPAAKEAGAKEMPNKKDNNNGRRNRFIKPPAWKYPVFLKCHIRTGRLYHAGFFKSNTFYGLG